MDNTSRSVIYAVNSDLDDGILYAEFETKEAALEYAKRNLDKLPFVDELEVSRDANGDIDNVFSYTTIWSHDEEATPTETEDDYWDDLAVMYDEEQANKHDLGDTTWFESMDNLVETLEENEDEVECKECFELFPKVDCVRVDIGYVCPTCSGHGVVSDSDIFKLDFPEYDKFPVENEMIPVEPVAEVESDPEVEPIEEVPVEEPTEEPVVENDPVSEEEVEEIEDPEEEPLEEDLFSSDYRGMTKDELYGYLTSGESVEIDAGDQGVSPEDAGRFSDGGYYSNTIIWVDFDGTKFNATEFYMSESGDMQDGHWTLETESFDELWDELLTFNPEGLTEDISEDELDAEIEKAKKTLTLAKLNTKIEKQRTKASKQGAKQAKNDLSATKSTNKAVKDTSKTDVSTSKDDVKVAKNDLKRAKIDAKRQEVESGSDSSDDEESAPQEVEIKETLTEAKRDPFHEAIFEAIDYLTEFSDIFPVPGNIGANNWEELKDDINYGLSSDFEIAEILMEYLKKDIAVGEKHPEIFEDDPQSELTLETYNRLKRAYDKAVADYEAAYPEDFEESFTPEEMEEFNMDEEGNSLDGYDRYVRCTWCDEIYTESECDFEYNLGWLCDRCQSAITSRGERLMLVSNPTEEDIARTLEEGAEFGESAILAGVATTVASGVIVDVVKRIMDKFGEGKKKSKWIDFRKHVIEKTPDGTINIWNHDSEQVASDLKTVAAAKEKIKEINQKAKEDKRAAKKNKNKKDDSTETKPTEETPVEDSKKSEAEEVEIATESLTEEAEDEIEPISNDPAEKPAKKVKMQDTASTGGMDFEDACKKFGINLEN